MRRRLRLVIPLPNARFPPVSDIATQRGLLQDCWVDQPDSIIFRIWLAAMLLVGLVSPIFIHERYTSFVSAACACVIAFYCYRWLGRSLRR